MPNSKAIIDTEQESSRGWEYVARVQRDGAESRHVVLLAWSDHDHWSGGTVPPSRVVEALLRIAGDHLATIPVRFDASTLRRLIPDLDASVRAEINHDVG